jgi:hypothetical protein
MGTLEYVDLIAKMGTNLNPCVINNTTDSNKLDLIKYEYKESTNESNNNEYNEKLEKLEQNKTLYNSDINNYNSVFNFKQKYTYIKDKFVTDENVNYAEMLNILNYFDIKIQNYTINKIAYCDDANILRLLTLENITTTNDHTNTLSKIFKQLNNIDDSKQYCLLQLSEYIIKLTMKTLLSLLIFVNNIDKHTFDFSLKGVTKGISTSKKEQINSINISKKNNTNIDFNLDYINNFENVKLYFSQCIFKKYFEYIFDNGVIDKSLFNGLNIKDFTFSEQNNKIDPNKYDKKLKILTDHKINSINSTKQTKQTKQYTIDLKDQISNFNQDKFFLNEMPYEINYIDEQIQSDNCKIEYTTLKQTGSNDELYRFYPNIFLYNVLNTIKYPENAFKKNYTTTIYIPYYAYYGKNKETTTVYKYKGGKKNKTVKLHRKSNI